MSLVNIDSFMSGISMEIGVKDGELGPVAEQNYEKWNCTIFVIWIFDRKSKLSEYV